MLDEEFSSSEADTLYVDFFFEKKKNVLDVKVPPGADGLYVEFYRSVRCTLQKDQILTLCCDFPWEVGCTRT